MTTLSKSTSLTHEQLNILFLASAIKENQAAALYYLKRGPHVLANYPHGDGADINFVPSRKDDSPETRALLDQMGYNPSYNPYPLPTVSALDWHALRGNRVMSEWLIDQGARMNNALANAAYGLRYHTSFDRIGNMCEFMLTLIGKGARLDQKSWYLTSHTDHSTYLVQGTPLQALHAGNGNGKAPYRGEYEINVMNLMSQLNDAGQDAVRMANNLLADPKQLKKLIEAWPQTPVEHWAGPILRTAKDSTSNLAVA